MTPSGKKIQVKEDENTSIKSHLLVVPYQGEKGIHIVNSMKRYTNKIQPENVKVQAAFTGKRLSSCFKTKDRTKFEHQHGIIYQVKFSSENCSDDYIEESARRIIESVKDNGGGDAKSHVLKHSSEKEQVEVTRKTLKLSAVILKTTNLKGRSLRHY